MIIMVVIELPTIRLVKRISAPQPVRLPAIGLERRALLRIFPDQPFIGIGKVGDRIGHIFLDPAAEGVVGIGRDPAVGQKDGAQAVAVVVLVDRN